MYLNECDIEEIKKCAYDYFSGVCKDDVIGDSYIANEIAAVTRFVDYLIIKSEESRG